MGYSTPILGVERERNIGAGVDEVGTLTITGPTSIEGSSVLVEWTLGGVLADTFRITLGTTTTDAQIADTGEVQSEDGEDHQWLFTNLTYPTTTAYLTIRYKYGNGPFHEVQRTLPINVEQIPIDDDPAKNWDDSALWDDDSVWTD